MEKKIIRIFVDMKQFYQEGRSPEDELVQKKAFEFVSILSTGFKQATLSEIEKLANRIDEKPQFSSSLVDKKVEEYMSEVLSKLDADKMKALRLSN